MRRFVSKIALVGVVAAGALSASSANAAGATGGATAKILSALTVTKTSDLDFGSIVAGSSASTVAVAADNSRTCGSGLVCSATTTAGAFDVTGAGGQTVTITVDATATLTDSASNSMTATLTPSASTVTLAAGGTGNFKVSGSLAVGANQAAGTYNGTYNVSADYQ